MAGDAQSRSPSVYSIPPHLPFADTLAAGILGRQTGDPLTLSRTRIFVPHRRAARALREAFLRQGGGEAVILPRITAIGDVDEDELSLTDVAGAGLTLPPAISRTRRQLLLMPLVTDFLKRSGLGGAHGPAIAPALAAEFARLIDLFHTEALGLADLAAASPEELAHHWQQTLKFLQLAYDAWPSILAEEGALDPADRRNRLLAAQAERWRAAPPDHPVIAAGSTGSIPAVARLLSVIARLPQGNVVLPGLDAAMDAASWNALEQSHPQYGMKALLDTMRVDRAEVDPWPTVQGGDEKGAARSRLLSEIMRPAATTDAWRSTRLDPAALDGLTRLELEDTAQEAGVIALIMRGALETPARTAALVTPDRGLARRVIAQLKQWDIAVDDSAGTPLTHTAIGSLLTLIIDLTLVDWTPARLLSLLKHPLTALGYDTATCRRLTRGLEMAMLRGSRPAPGIDGLRRLLDGKTRHFAPFIDRLEGALQPLAALPANADLAEMVRAHVAAAEALAADQEQSGAARLWRGEAGELAAATLEDLIESGAGLMLARDVYPALLNQFLAQAQVRPRYGLHPRLFVWSPMEARLQRADVMILGGLNEGQWPAEAEPNAWLSRPMQRQLGLPLPERQIGQSAHDFVGAAAAPTVCLTRALKAEGVPTVPSRWLLRLTALTRHASLDQPQWRHWRQAMQQAEAHRPARPPAPTPPLTARPAGLSVTDVERWMRDPYALYARKILRLAPLDPIDAELGAAERGTLIHKVFEDFLKEDDWHEERLIALAERELAQAKARPLLRVLWKPRFRHLARWFVETLHADARAGRRPAFTEVRKDWAFDVDGSPFTLTAKADRIDATPDGIVIVDYKTGSVPKKKQIEAGYAPQLPLEALMAEGGAFGEAARRVAGLEFWQMKGTTTPAEVMEVKDFADRVAHAREGLAAMVRRFRDEATPYLSQPRPEEAKDDDYDHLARVGEWRGGEWQEGGGE